MLVSMVALEGLQPVVTEAFLKDSDQCEMDAVKGTNEGWKIWIVMIVVFTVQHYWFYSSGLCDLQDLQTL